MPMSIDETVDALNDDLRQTGGSVKTYTWPDFYKRFGIIRFKQSRGQQIQEKASGKFGLIVACGQNACLPAGADSIGIISH
jgi:hypothetical protein